MSLSAEFVAKYQPLGRGHFMDVWIEDLTRDELIAVLGWMNQQWDTDRRQAKADFNFAMDLARSR